MTVSRLYLIVIVVSNKFVIIVCMLFRSNKSVRNSIYDLWQLHVSHGNISFDFGVNNLINEGSTRILKTCQKRQSPQESVDERQRPH